MYKVRPDGDTKAEKERPVKRLELKKFLYTWCALDDDDGNIFLSGAGGIPSSEVEVVADALIDHGLCTPEDLLFMVRNMADALGEVGGIQLNARTRIIVGVLRREPIDCFSSCASGRRGRSACEGPLVLCRLCRPGRHLCSSLSWPLTCTFPSTRWRGRLQELPGEPPDHGLHGPVRHQGRQDKDRHELA